MGVDRWASSGNGGKKFRFITIEILHVENTWKVKISTYEPSKPLTLYKLIYFLNSGLNIYLNSDSPYKPAHAGNRADQGFWVSTSVIDKAERRRDPVDCIERTEKNSSVVH